MDHCVHVCNVRDGTVEVALLDGVPVTTLKDCLSGRVHHETNSVPKWYLNEDEESVLADQLLQTARIGHGKRGNK